MRTRKRMRKITIASKTVINSTDEGIETQTEKRYTEQEYILLQ